MHPQQPQDDPGPAWHSGQPGYAGEKSQTNPYGQFDRDGQSVDDRQTHQPGQPEGPRGAAGPAWSSPAGAPSLNEAAAPDRGRPPAKPPRAVVPAVLALVSLALMLPATFLPVARMTISLGDDESLNQSTDIFITGSYATEAFGQQISFSNDTVLWVVIALMALGALGAVLALAVRSRLTDALGLATCAVVTGAQILDGVGYMTMPSYGMIGSAVDIEFGVGGWLYLAAALVGAVAVGLYVRHLVISSRSQVAAA